ncbi:hypothetical protein [Streptomyces sp. SPB162]|uniref:hypothetical protein n=1 Tax=Streptomyces sp. SPB162 TaxID=2940560 RepID=UPI002405BE19|nr:hypothetical protein [Streptomyces sp. SPB162]MDF9816690.1 hypothetical protein [Streptomyces sp. SPB162]
MRPVDLLAGMQPQATGWFYRRQAQRRLVAFASGAAVSLRCRLTAQSDTGAHPEHLKGQLYIEPHGVATLFVSLRGWHTITIPVGGTVIRIATARPQRMSIHGKRTMTQYRAPEGDDFWIETAAHDVGLLHQVLMSPPARAPFKARGNPAGG